jgi:hypothetical protein
MHNLGEQNCSTLCLWRCSGAGRSIGVQCKISTGYLGMNFWNYSFLNLHVHFSSVPLFHMLAVQTFNLHAQRGDALTSMSGAPSYSAPTTLFYLLTLFPSSC